MAKFDFNRATLPLFVERVGRLVPDTPRQWGTMGVTRALRHLIFTFEMSLGVQRVPDTSKPIAREVIYLVFFRWYTNWPQGKIKAPAFVTPEPKGEFAAERAELLRRMEQFVGDLEREPERIAVNPGLGGISLARWSRVHGVHCDHHLRQFGV